MTIKKTTGETKKIPISKKSVLCKPTEELIDGKCKVKCKKDQTRNKATGRCKKPVNTTKCKPTEELINGKCKVKCKKDQTRNKATGRCKKMTDTAKCKPTEELINGKCKVKCKEDQTRNKATGRCKKMVNTETNKTYNKSVSKKMVVGESANNEFENSIKNRVDILEEQMGEIKSEHNHWKEQMGEIKSEHNHWKEQMGEIKNHNRYNNHFLPSPPPPFVGNSADNRIINAHERAAPATISIVRNITPTPIYPLRDSTLSPKQHPVNRVRKIKSLMKLNNNHSNTKKGHPKTHKKNRVQRRLIKRINNMIVAKSL
jgi:hypothetical protein